MADPMIELAAPPKLGESYHVSWAGNGVMGICTSIDQNNRTVILKRPKTMESFRYPVPFHQLRHTRIQEQRYQETGSPYPDRTNDQRHHKRLVKFGLPSPYINRKRRRK